MDTVRNEPLMSLNDPQWGRRPGRGNEGPLDLEKLWRGLRRKIESLFGGRGGGDGAGSGAHGPRPTGGMALLAALVAVIWLASGFYIVPEGQRGVVLRFGEFVETTMPGPRWHLPYPIESAEIVNLLGVRTVEVGYRNDVRNNIPRESLMLTDDENIVDVQFAVQYVLKSPDDYLFNSRDPDGAVLQAAESAVREVVGKSSMDFVLYEGRAEVAARAHKLMQDILDRYGTGINISKVTMQNAQPPDQVQAAFNDAVRASQDRERQKNEGQAYANDVIPRARGQAARLNEEAEGYKQRVVEEAQGDASRFSQIVTEYKKAPKVTRERLYVEAMEQIMKNTSKVLVDQSEGNSLLYLPLDKLLEANRKGAPEPAQPAETPPPPRQGEAPQTGPARGAEAPAALDDNTVARSREAFRSRDREVR